MSGCSDGGGGRVRGVGGGRGVGQRGVTGRTSGRRQWEGIGRPAFLHTAVRVRSRQLVGVAQLV